MKIFIKEKAYDDYESELWAFDDETISNTSIGEFIDSIIEDNTCGLIENWEVCDEYVDGTNFVDIYYDGTLVAFYAFFSSEEDDYLYQLVESPEINEVLGHVRGSTLDATHPRTDKYMGRVKSTMTYSESFLLADNDEDVKNAIEIYKKCVYDGSEDSFREFDDYCEEHNIVVLYDEDELYHYLPNDLVEVIPYAKPYGGIHKLNIVAEFVERF